MGVTPCWRVWVQGNFRQDVSPSPFWSGTENPVEVGVARMEGVEGVAEGPKSHLCWTLWDPCLTLTFTILLSTCPITLVSFHQACWGWVIPLDLRVVILIHTTCHQGGGNLIVNYLIAVIL